MIKTYNLSNGEVVTKEITKENKTKVIMYKCNPKNGGNTSTFTFYKEYINFIEYYIYPTVNQSLYYSEIEGIRYVKKSNYIIVYGGKNSSKLFFRINGNQEIYDEIKQILNQKGVNVFQAEEQAKKRQRHDKISVYIIIIIVLLLGASCSIIKSDDSSKWDNLSDTEKEWYSNNYGNGKMDDINSAIKNYRGY